MRAATAIAIGVIALAAAIVATAGGTAVSCPLPRGSEHVAIDPARFTTRIDNPWWPMKPGSRWVYRETDPAGAKQRVVTTVTRKRKRIANGVTARVVHDVVTEDGELVEVTDDWYAQDPCGNVWYLGEATRDYENGRVVSTEGSWEAGVDGAEPGVIVPARPRPGLRYRQEYYRRHAEDRGDVLSLREQVEVPFGHFPVGSVLMTRDLSRLEPKVLEYKFYARGVGLVLAIAVSGGSDREELVRFRRGR